VTDTPTAPDAKTKRLEPISLTPIHLDLGPYELVAATAFGPRLIGLSRRGGPQVLAELDDSVSVEHPGGGIYRFHGGHRLWAAPEIPLITYAPDDQPCLVAAMPDGFTISSEADVAGMVKELRIGLEDDRLTVHHVITNRGHIPIRIAPWAITQFRMGGIALIPTGDSSSSDPLQADRSLVLWPYTDLTDPRLSWSERSVSIEAKPGPRLKVGVGPNPGMLGYFIDGYLFTKDVTPQLAAEYPDRGAVAQAFVEEFFCELESLGPLQHLEPGASATHREVWHLAVCPDLGTARRLVTGQT
jgi:hypothetical protein